MIHADDYMMIGKVACGFAAAYASRP